MFRDHSRHVRLNVKEPSEDGDESLVGVKNKLLELLAYKVYKRRLFYVCLVSTLIFAGIVALRLTVSPDMAVFVNDHGEIVIHKNIPLTLEEIERRHHLGNRYRWLHVALDHQKDRKRKNATKDSVKFGKTNKSSTTKINSTAESNSFNESSTFYGNLTADLLSSFDESSIFSENNSIVLDQLIASSGSYQDINEIDIMPTTVVAMQTSTVTMTTGDTLSPTTVTATVSTKFVSDENSITSSKNEKDNTEVSLSPTINVRYKSDLKKNFTNEEFIQNSSSKEYSNVASTVLSISSTLSEQEESVYGSSHPLSVDGGEFIIQSPADSGFSDIFTSISGDEYSSLHIITADVTQQPFEFTPDVEQQTIKSMASSLPATSVVDNDVTMPYKRPEMTAQSYGDATFVSMVTVAPSPTEETADVVDSTSIKP